MEHGTLWFWFVRPIAEMLGELAIIVAILIPLGLLALLLNYKAKRRP